MVMEEAIIAGAKAIDGIGYEIYDLGSDKAKAVLEATGWQKLYDALKYCADERNSNGYVVARAALQEVDRMIGK